MTRKPGCWRSSIISKRNGGATKKEQITYGFCTYAFFIEIFQMFLIINGCTVLFMQCGFALLEAGAVRAKNVTNVLLKNFLDACEYMPVRRLLSFIVFITVIIN